MTPAEFIRSARKLSAKNQSHFAAAMGITQPTLSRWEAGKKEPAHAMLERAAKLAGGALRLAIVARKKR